MLVLLYETYSPSVMGREEREREREGERLFRGLHNKTWRRAPEEFLAAECLGLEMLDCCVSGATGLGS